MSDELKQSAFNSSLITHHSSLKNGDALDLDLRAVFEQGFDFDQTHRGLVAAHQRAPALAYLGGAREVLALVRHVDDEAGHAARSPARLAHHFEHVAERALELLDEIVAHDPLPLVPSDLPRDEEQTHARRRQQSVRVAARATERFGINESEKIIH